MMPVRAPISPAPKLRETEENFLNDIFGSRAIGPAERGAAGCSLAPDCLATLRLSVMQIGGIVATRAAGSRPPSTAAAAILSSPSSNGGPDGEGSGATSSSSSMFRNERRTILLRTPYSIALMVGESSSRKEARLSSKAGVRQPLATNGSTLFQRMTNIADPTSWITLAAGLFWLEACVYDALQSLDAVGCPAGPVLPAFGTKNGLRWCVIVSWADSVTSKMAEAIRLRWYRAIISTCKCECV
uniref:Uncharacterized protein n=1 Tax=Anopheles farauti TaxID=69004 RepID=A0A182QLE4_9DIPT